MQSFQWYARRLCSMSPGEVFWRLRSWAAESWGNWLLPWRSPLPRLQTILVPGRPASLLFHDADMRHTDALSSESFPREWSDALVGQADRVARGSLCLFDQHCDYENGEIDWNYEPQAQRPTPLCPASRIDYRDIEVTGDCKWVWEPNRHHHLPILARAYRITGEEFYSRTALEHIECWIEQCPHGYGMNWRSPLELAIRMINWTWTVELLRGSSALDDRRSALILQSVHQHLSDISSKYSRYSSANNHLIGEAAGVLIAATYFTSLKRSQRWRDRGRTILEREIVRQSHVDGGSREQGFGYHLFVLEFFTLAGLAARRGGLDFSKAYWNRLERMYEFAAALTEGGDDWPMIGDSDDGFVVDLGGRDDRIRSLLGVGGILFDRADWRDRIGDVPEPAWWLFGPNRAKPLSSAKLGTKLDRIASQAFPDSGYFLLQTRQTLDHPAVSVILDVGELGFGTIAAHGHADTLSLQLRVDGHDVLVDPGTYDYFTYPEWREYFRSTRAHNTIELDGIDQSEMLGPFLWGRRAKAYCRAWEPDDHGGRFVGEHDGYRRLTHPAIHRRAVTLSGREGCLTVEDEVITDGEHEVTQFWHFAESCVLQQVSESEFLVDIAGRPLRFQMDPALSVERVRGNEHPIGGWRSRGYHSKTPTTTLAGRRTIRQTQGFKTIIGFLSCNPRALEPSSTTTALFLGKPEKRSAELGTPLHMESIRGTNEGQ